MLWLDEGSVSRSGRMGRDWRPTTRHLLRWRAVWCCGFKVGDQQEMSSDRLSLRWFEKPSGSLGGQLGRPGTRE